MRKAILMAASAAVLAAGALTATAFAQGPGGPPEGPPGGPAEMLFQLDANHDNVVTKAEFDAGRAAHFAQADTNHDGSLSYDEMRAMHRAMRGDHHGDHGRGHRGERGEHRLERADANHDGRITRDEFLAGPLEMFNHLDANHDGVLSGDERNPPDFEGRHGRHGDRPDFDTDHNGTISRTEFNAMGDRMFEHLDADHDGRVTRAEAEAARPPMGPPPGGPDGPPPR